MSKLLSVTLEFARSKEPQDPYGFRFEPQEYTLRTPGGSRERFDIDWSRLLLTDLAALRESTVDPELLQRLGNTLKNSLGTTGWRAVGQRIECAVRNGQRVSVTIRSSAAELYTLPWELLVLDSGQHLGELHEVVLRYTWPDTLTRPAIPRIRPEGGRTLVVWSAAGGPLPYVEHLRAIRDAYEQGNFEFDIELDVIANASSQAIAETLTRATSEGRPYSILHVLCHGSPVGPTFGLILDSLLQKRELVDVGRVRRLLVPHANTLRLIVLSVCDGGNPGHPGNHLGSIAQALHRGGVRSVVASRYPLTSTGSTKFTQEFYQALLVEFCSLERAFSKARERLAKETNLDWASLQLYGRAEDGDDTRPVVVRPYRGLEIFETKHRHLFFGRDSEIIEAVKKIKNLRSLSTPRILIISGASGSGKSSLARAGIIPRLQVDFAGVNITRPSDETSQSPCARPLLQIVDQGEELFTTLDDKARLDLFKHLCTIATDDAGSVVVLTLRVEFIGRCQELVLPDGQRFDRLEAKSEHRVYLCAMNREDMLEAISGPAHLIGLPLQDGLADQLIDDVGCGLGALPILEFALDRMWCERTPGGLGFAGYRAFGGAVGVLLEREADKLIDSMNDIERVEARRILVQLVGHANTRRIRYLRDLCFVNPIVSNKVLTRLISARFVVTSYERKTQVEIAHEELIRRWGQLRKWVDIDRRKSDEIERVRIWSNDTEFLRGERLKTACDTRRKYNKELGERALAYIEESERAAISEIRSKRLRLMQLVASLIVIVIITMVAVDLSLKAQKSVMMAIQSDIAAKHAATVESNTRYEVSREKVRSARARQASLLTTVPFKEYEELKLLILSLRPANASSEIHKIADVLHRIYKCYQLQGHTDAVWGVAFSPDGQLFATASKDHSARVWDAESGEPIATLQGHLGPIGPITFSPDGQTLATSSEDGTVRLWGPLTGMTIASLRGHSGDVRSLAFSPDGHRIATGGEDHTARVWDTESGEFIVALDGHSGMINDVVYSPDGQYIGTASDDHTARLWDASSGKLKRTLKGHSEALLSVAFSPFSDRVATASADKSGRLWDRRSGDLIASLEGHSHIVTAIAFSPGGRNIATASADHTLRFWDAYSGDFLSTLKGHSAPVWGLAFSPDGHTIASRSEDATTRLWRVTSGTTKAVFQGIPESLGRWSIAFSPDGTRFAASSESTTCLRETVSRAPITVLDGHSQKITGVAYSSDGQRIATAADDRARLWDARSGDVVASLENSVSTISVAFSSDSRFIATATRKEVHVFDGFSGEPLVTLAGHTGLIRDLVFSPDGNTIATASFDRTARIWAPNTGEVIATFEHSDWVRDVDFSSDGHRIVTASRTVNLWEPTSRDSISLDHPNVVFVGFSPDGKIVATGGHEETRLWSAGSGQLLRILKGGVKDVAFSPDGRKLVTVGRQVSPHVWSVSSGETITSLSGHSGDWFVEFSPDSSRVILGGEDTIAQLWDTASRESISLEGHTGMIWDAAFSPGGHRVVTVSFDHTALVWPVTPKEWVRRGCNVLRERPEYDEEVTEACAPYL